MTKTLKCLVCISIAMILLGAASVILYGSYINAPAGDPLRTMVLNIPKGVSFSWIAGQLEEAGLVRDRRIFIAFACLRRATVHVKAGEYELSGRLSPAQILDKMVRGEVREYLLSFPEGFTLRQVARRLADEGLVSETAFLAAASDAGFLGSLKIEGDRAEGYLFPETYRFTRLMDEKQIIRMMVQEFRRRFTPVHEARAAELGMSIRDIVTLASIVEKEGGPVREKSLIAAVFYNRLKKGMRLESDPTVIYGIENFNGNLTREHLRQKTPYNTYVIRSLPPGPICNPGLDALMAALYPADVKFLFFVARNDGTHCFSADLESHQKAIVTYQIKKEK
ncbi:MAG: endolytic transglycosylase MltG [Deltaproteobacteria bacterium]|nr:endolytic transglycosylase MltG [Deltaproteobacteria bacterium]